MVDWTESMQQTFEYYVVDPDTWKDKERLTTVKSCTISRDAEAETLGSATFDIIESIGECYIRVYLVTIQNGVKERHPLGTFLVQTPTSSFDGKVRSVSMDAYTPLIELKENYPPIGYYIPKSEEGAEINVMDIAYRLVRETCRAPVIKTENPTNNQTDFVASTDDTWLSFLTDFMAAHAYHGGTGKPTIASYTFALDEMGRILFAPKQDASSLQPVWTYDDGNSSILYPELTMDHDLYDIPNVVEVTYSNGAKVIHKEVKNEDPNSPTSIQRRGRKITYRETSPQIIGNPSEEQVQEYAEQLLSALSTVEYSITYTHAYCPTRLNDCVRLNYSRSGLNNVTAKVISQSIRCEPGCPVTEKATYTAKLWR